MVYDRLPMGARWSWLVERWDLDALRRLRSRVGRLLEVGGPPPAADLRALDRVLAGAPLVWRVSREPGSTSFRLRPVAPGVPHVVASIVVSIMEVLSGESSGVHRCANPHYSVLSRDASRTGSRRWCDPRICGNLVKVGAFRAGRIAGDP